jgi:hypothetical protein
MGQVTTFRTRFAEPTIQKAYVDAANMCVQSVLTYPVHDLAGDFVAPTGGDYSSHEADCWNDLEHNGLVVCWARESLHEDGAPYSVVLKSLMVDGKPTQLPVGTSYFDPHDRLSTQVFSLIERDLIPGVSLEFKASQTHAPRILKAVCPLDSTRPSLHFDHWRAMRWTHCVTPVNPGAMTLKKAIDPKLEPLVALLQTKKIGSESLHPSIFKSLSRYLPEANKSAVHLDKAMPTNTPDSTYDQPLDADANAPAPENDDGGTDEATQKSTPTAQAAYDASQMLKDLCGHIKESVADGEHVQGRKALMSICDMIDKTAEKCVEIGDRVAKDVKGGGMMKEDGDEGGEDEGDEADKDMEDKEPDMETDEEDGVMKCLKHPSRRVYLKAIKRFTVKEVAKARSSSTDTTQTATIDPTTVSGLTKAIRKLKQTLNS